VTDWVVDASVAFKWVIAEPGSEDAAALLPCALAAPDLLLAEVANALWNRARRGELTADEALRRVSQLRTAPVEWVAAGSLILDASRLASELGHPVYDCLYLALAIQRNCRVVTADARFAKAVTGHPETARVVLLGA
jgi:predicted nucleic acid-binding protein